ncbi:hypothetical protein [Nocardioides convexus]|uniref:magnesium chelatase subunit ChlI family protein n=1 Tax=Nocardioides convexus TaxID=2712224 RepID=UPI00241814D5|nr:hypothetical protein [Nocardioides convexus]
MTRSARPSPPPPSGSGSPAPATARPGATPSGPGASTPSLPGPRLEDTWPLTRSAQRLIADEARRGRLSARGVVRVQRVAWTVADLRSVRDGRDHEPGLADAETALRLRAGLPLDLADLRDGPRRPGRPVASGEGRAPSEAPSSRSRATPAGPGSDARDGQGVA